VIGTYAAVLAVCAASPAIGQAAIALCGVRHWSWLSPAVGLALLGAICWGTVRLPGGGALSAVAVLVLAVAALFFLRGRTEGAGRALRVGAPVALLALAAASLPFVAEGHFGILGTSFNPDMSQHLLATDHLAHGIASPLLRQGYPLGPHAIVVALSKGLGIGLVQGFSGLTLAVAILAPLTALTAFADLSPLRRTAGALLVGLPYIVASYYAQGAFKETIQALYVLAFALALREATANPAWRELPLRFIPAALLAAGSVYTYSFPGLIWLVGTAAIWAIAEWTLNRNATSAGGAGGRGFSASPESAEGKASSWEAHGPSARSRAQGQESPLPPATGPAVVRSVLLAVLLFIVLVAPEIGRMIDFHSFETFDPNGPGLGNLFGQISPFEALGIWPSGDFRLAPGDGAVPAFGYYLGAAFALALLVYGATRCIRRRETAILAGFAAACLAYAAAGVGGTPYTAAKAIEIAAPLCALVVVLPLLDRPVEAGEKRFSGGAIAGLAALAYLAAAAACSLLAFANAPVGPSSYSPALTALRPLIAADSTLVLATPELLAEQHGAPYISWELRGGRVCIKSEDEAGHALLPGVRFVVTQGGLKQQPYSGLRVLKVAPPYVLWETVDPVRGHSPCPLIAVRQARQGPRSN
jgi:hypothetical protein